MMDFPTLDTGPAFMGQSFENEFSASRLLLLQAAISAVASKYSTMCLGVDLSSYCGALTNDDFSAMYAGGVRWVSARASSGWQQTPGDPYNPANYVDTQFTNYCQYSYNNDLMFLPYHFPKFDNPQAGTPDADNGYKALAYALKGKIPGKSYHGIAWDCEDKSNTNTNTKNYLNTLYGWALKDPQINTVPQLFYSSPGWFNQYPAVRDWIGSQVASQQKLCWLAQWIYNATPTTTITWEQLPGYYPSDAYKPQPPAFDDYKLLQWAVNYIGMQGTHNHQIDLNFYHGTYAQMCDFFNYTPRTAPVPPIVPPVTPPTTDVQAQIDAINLELHGIVQPAIATITNRIDNATLTI
jgi:hypothetical protein